MKKQAFNPYLPSLLDVPDEEPHVFGDRVYIWTKKMVLLWKV